IGHWLSITSCILRNDPYFCRSFLTTYAMSVTRLKRKNRKDKAKAARRRTSLKTQNFKPVAKAVDIEKIKESFKKSA
ncbi:MAG: hypothetical protein ACOVMQ_02040, partial [Cyclobacteriaceae bacterium]